MKVGTWVFRIATASVLGGLLASVQMGTASPDPAGCAGTIAKDQASEAHDVASASTLHVGDCWQYAGANFGVSGPGGTCLPGSVGLCLAALQNQTGSVQRQPAQKAPPPGPPPSSWP